MKGLTGDEAYGSDIVLDTFPGPYDPAYGCCVFTKEAIRYYRSLKSDKSTLRVIHYPEFVHFVNLKDPTTVEDVVNKIATKDWDYKKENHFEEMFGKGVSLQDVTIEVTDEPITAGLVLKYLPPFRPHANQFFRNDFIIGEKP